MIALLIIGLIGTQLALALFSPVGLAYVSLVVGAMPLTLGHDGMFSGAFGRMDLSAIRLLGLWLASCVVVLWHLGRLPRYLNAFRFHALFLVFCALAMLWSPSLAYGTRMFAKLSAPFLFLLLIVLMISTHAQLKIMERLILGTGALLATVAVAVKLAGVSVSKVGLTLPGVGPSLFSAFLVVVALLALASVTYGNRVRYLMLVVVLCAAVLAAFTRITIAAMFVGCAVIVFMGCKGLPRVVLPVIGLVGFPALFLFSETFKKRMFYGTNQITLGNVLDDPSMVMGHLHTSGRSKAWGSVLGQFFEPSPFVGSGLGATQNYYYSQIGGGIGVIHSEYVRLLSEVGLIGLSLFALAAVAYLWRLVRIHRQTHSPDTSKYALAAVGALVAYLIFIATDNGFDYVTGFGIYVFSLIGMAEKASELEDADPSPGCRLGPENEGTVPNLLGIVQPAGRYPIVGAS
jgi:O-antigen ligase